MSAISSERSVPPSALWRRLLVNMAMRTIIRWKCGRMIQMLHALDDRQLHDMGLARDQIEAAVHTRYEADVAQFR
jgi:uncharacterized protein YjiS (DUF1127 family)